MEKGADLSKKAWYRALKVVYIIANILGIFIVILLAYVFSYQNPFLFLMYGVLIVLLFFRIIRSIFLYIYNKTPFGHSFLPKVWLITIGVIVFITILSLIGTMESASPTPSTMSNDQVPINTNTVNSRSQTIPPIVQSQPAPALSKNEQNCQTAYTAWVQKHVDSSNGIIDVGLGAHFNTSMGVCLIEDKYTDNTSVGLGSQAYDVFDASKENQNPMPTILQLDIESPSAMQEYPGITQISLYQNDQEVNTPDPEEKFNQLKAILFSN